MTVGPFGQTGDFGAQQERPYLSSRTGRRSRAFAAVLASTHAPLLALLAHGLLSSVAGFASRRPSGSALAVTLGATVLGSAVSLRELRSLDRTVRSLEDISSRDPLTGVYNRRAGEERLAGDLARASRDGKTFTLVVLDLDGLKELNDSLGHPFGDVLLNRVSEALRRNLREGDWMARWGGDEFVLGLWDTADRDTATKVLERVAQQLQETAPSPPNSSGVSAESPEPLRPSFSAGVVVCQPGDDPQRCLARADAFLHEAKRGGVGRIVHEPGQEGSQ